MNSKGTGLTLALGIVIGFIGYILWQITIGGGVFFDLAGHMIDQICWIQGRPKKIKSFFMNSDSKNRDFHDNTVSIFEYDQSMTIVDIAAMEAKPMARRFEVYGTKGSAIMEPDGFQ